jgi:hypothetical protein
MHLSMQMPGLSLLFEKKLSFSSKIHAYFVWEWPHELKQVAPHCGGRRQCFSMCMLHGVQLMCIESDGMSGPSGRRKLLNEIWALWFLLMWECPHQQKQLTAYCGWNMVISDFTSWIWTMDILYYWSCKGARSLFVHVCAWGVGWGGNSAYAIMRL